MFYEKRVRTFARLLEELERIDFDSGVRVVGSFHDKRCFAFVTRSSLAYVAVVCERTGGRSPQVGHRIISMEFGSVGQVGKFLREIVGRRVEAYVY